VLPGRREHFCLKQRPDRKALAHSLGSHFVLALLHPLLHILHVRLSFGIVHSIIIYSTISKITVRPREIGKGGTGVTSNHDNGDHRGSDSVFYRLI
jgi:hypothetical protein